MSYNTFSTIITDGLILYFDAANNKSYSGSGTWYDLTSNYNNSVLFNGSSFSSSSILFDGVDDYVGTNIFTLKSIVSRPCSLSVWFKTNISNNIRQAIVADWDSSGNNETTRLEISGFGMTPGSVGGNLVNQNGGGGSVESTTIIQTNVWYNVVIQCPTTTTTELYLNGVLEDSASSIEGIISIGELVIGRGGSFDNLYLSGNISNISVYNISLTPTEIMQNYTALKNRFI